MNSPNSESQGLQYYAVRGGQRCGPFTYAELQDQHRHGEGSPDEFVWCHGMKEWQRFSQLVPPIPSGAPSDSSPPTGMPSLDAPKPPSFAYYVNTSQGLRGPLSLDELERMLDQGVISRETLAWRQGTSNWVPIRQIIYSGPDWVHTAANAAAEWLKTDRLRNFDLKVFLSDIFKLHTEEEISQFFCMGGPETTPPLQSVRPVWPSPWVFTRVLGWSLLLYIGFEVMLHEFGSLNLIPGYIFAGNFAIPFSFLVLFAELNIQRNVSWFSIMKMMLGGGMIAIFFSFILYNYLQTEAPVWAGPIEEIAKLAAVFFMARRRYWDGRILTGLACGAAVGAGFAVFESAGYVLAALLNNEAPTLVMVFRAILAPFAHIVWTAITAGALWRVAANFTRFDPQCLIKQEFLRLAIVPVVLHMLWNCSLFNFLFVLKYIVLGAVAWLLVLLLANEGISQIANAQNSAKR